MSNLIPLFLDKETGRWPVAKEQTDNNNIPAGFFIVVGYVYIHTDNLNVWEIQHNGQSENLITQIFSETGEQIYPDSINIIDNNNIRINFATPMNGKALLMIFRENAS